MSGNLKEAKFYVKRLSRCLNLDKELPDLRQAIGFESILYLAEVLHRIEMPPFTDIPDRTSRPGSEDNQLDHPTYAYHNWPCERSVVYREIPFYP